jgi:hypothetical protein
MLSKIDPLHTRRNLFSPDGRPGAQALLKEWDV